MSDWPSDVLIHPSACVDPGCSLGAGTRIWHFSHVMAGASIGRDCTIGQNVFVASGAKIGNHVKVQNNVWCTTAYSWRTKYFAARRACSRT